MNIINFIKDKKLVSFLIVLAITLLPIMTNIMAWIPSKITKGSSTTWIGFFGNYFGSLVGGIIGALIAFGVAKYQIDHQKEYENKKMYISQLPTLIKLMMELEVFRVNFVSTKNIFIVKTDLPFPIDITTDYKLNNIKVEDYVDISNL